MLAPAIADAATLLLYAPLILTAAVPTIVGLLCGARFLFR
jgi:hypothetical protein